MITLCTFQWLTSTHIYLYYLYLYYAPYVKIFVANKVLQVQKSDFSTSKIASEWILGQVQEPWQRSQQQHKTSKYSRLDSTYMFIPAAAVISSVLGPQSFKFMGDASKQPQMRLIQGSTSYKEFWWPSRGATQPSWHYGPAGRSFSTPPIISICSLISLVCCPLVLSYSCLQNRKTQQCYNLI